jgi:Family of unknown function (DUF5989)
MKQTHAPMKPADDLGALASNPGFFGDLLYFVRTSKKWWMIPVISLLVLFGVLMLLSGTAAAPFIYTLF